MLSALILLILGLVCILVEFFVPGAVMGVLGTILLVVSLLVFGNEHSVVETLLYFLFICVLLGVLIKVALRRIQLSKNGLYSHGDQEGYLASEFDTSLIGKEGTVLSDLKPGGYIEIEGKQQQALSQSGYIVRGKPVRVIGGEGESLIVEEKES